VAFYLLVLPGVALHETAPYLACLLTRTRIKRFVPFSPENSSEGRLRLGYVRHEGRSPPVAALIGLAPIVLNPVGVLMVTVLLTPLTLIEVVDPQPGVLGTHILVRVSRRKPRRGGSLGLPRLQLRARERAEPRRSFLRAGDGPPIRFRGLRLELLSGRLRGRPPSRPRRTLRAGSRNLRLTDGSRCRERPAARPLGSAVTLGL
jgi:hypothetical protein